MIIFQKISETDYIQSCKDILQREDVDEIKDEYNHIIMPTRTSIGSAGYDFYLPFDIDLKAGGSICIPTCLSFKTNNPQVCLMVLPKSSIAVTYDMSFLNTIPLIDADDVQGFAGNQILLYIKVEKDCHLRRGKTFAQGVILPYLLVDDDNILIKRKKSLFKEQGYKPWGL